jgi:hypothetical protein
MPNPPIKDETVMAYADGELDATASEELEWEAEHDPEIGKRVVSFLRSRRLVKSALPIRSDDLAGNPLPPIPVETEPDGPMAAAAGPRRRGLRALAGVIAAGCAGVLFGAAFFGQSDLDSPAAALEARPTQVALDTLLTGEETVSGPARLRAIATYLLSDGQLCREVTVTIADKAGDAVVCRTDEGWSTRIAVIGPASSDYETAGGDGDPVDEYLRQIQAGVALSPEAEKAALADS